MKIDLYFWPINGQAWVLSWGLLQTMRNMGVLHRYGNIENWTDSTKIPQLLNTHADVILFVGFEHFRKKINTKLIRHRKAKIVCWTYESLTDPYGAKAWDTALGKHFMQSYKDFYNGFTICKDADLKDFDCMDAIFCADDLDFERFKREGFQAFWLPFGVDPDMFTPDPKMILREKNLKEAVTLPEPKLIKKARIRYGTRYGIRSGRSHAKPKHPRENLPVRSPKLMPGRRFENVGAFIGTRSNVRITLLTRMDLPLSLMQTPRKGDFGDVNKAEEHTKNLVRAYNSFLIQFNLRSIFAGVTPRAVESMACGRLLFQYLCAPDRPYSRKMFTNCAKYEILTDQGLRGVREKYRYFLNHPQEAMAIGRKAREEVIHGHTLKHRVNTIATKLKIVKKIDRDKNAEEATE